MPPYRVLFDNRKIQNKLEVSIIVPVFGRLDLLSQLIDSVYDFKSIDFELIIVDDGSKEPIEDVVQKHKNQLYGAVVRNEKNSGYAVACNLGTKESTGKYLLFLNSDIRIVHPNWIEPLLENLKTQPKAGTTSPVLFYENNIIQYAGAMFSQGDYEDGSFDHKHYYKYYTEKILPKNPYPTESLSGACFLIESRLFKQIKKFDEQFNEGYGFEDLDLAIRLSQKRLYNYVCPNSRLIHLESESFGKNIHTNSKKIKNRELFCKKWPELSPKSFYLTTKDLIKKEKPSWLVVSHGLPPTNVAGVEVYTYHLIKELSKTLDTTCLYALLSPNENEYPTGRILFDRKENNAKVFKMINGVDGYNFFLNQKKENNIDVFYSDFIKLLYETKPDVVFFQHTNFISIDLIKWVKQNTSAKILYALNEYLPICANNGQMVTKRNELCNGAEREKCLQCLKVVAPADLDERNKLYRENFKLVDMFVAPSEFLMQRFVEWGISNITYCDYGFARYKVDKRDPSRYKNKILTFGFMGTITPYKGIEILLKAFETQIPNAKLEIHGICNETSIKTKINDACNRPWIKYAGPYAPDAMPLIADQIDVLVVPSIWWENSPLVIHEARLLGMPVLTSNIGGMKELVEKLGGFTFARADYIDLRNKIIELENNRDLLKLPDIHIKTLEENVSELIEIAAKI